MKRFLCSICLISCFILLCLTGCSSPSEKTSSQDVLPDDGFYYDKISTSTQVCENDTNLSTEIETSENLKAEISDTSNVIEESSSTEVSLEEIPDEIKEIITRNALHLMQFHRKCIVVPFRPIGFRKF